MAFGSEGNLEDITLRALRILKEVDTIYCEDTRTSRVLLQKYDIQTRTKSYHAHSGAGRDSEVVAELLSGKSLALVSDAGTPCISDPGVRLVSSVRESAPEVRVESVPGPSALTTFLSIAGVYSDSYTFYGFMPHKKGRHTMIKTMMESEGASIFYESTHRIEKFLQEWVESGSGRRIVIGRELTKKFEEVFSGSASEILGQMQHDPNKSRGEFVVMVV